MRSYFHTLFILCVCALVICSCRHKRTTEQTPDTDSARAMEPDTTLWGRLGDGTGMSALEFVTDEGDTLELLRTDPYSGHDGRLVGDVRGTDDRFAVTLSADGETMRTAINATQLAQRWHTERGNMDVREDGAIQSEGLPYEGWKLWNGHILMSSRQQTEYGVVSRVDTMELLLLSTDSLVIRDHLGQIISFGKL